MHAQHPSTCPNTWQQAVLNQQLFHIVSDTVVHLSIYGTCAWAIWTTSDLWSGEGYVMGPASDMYAGLAKAPYGIYTVLSFFYQYFHLFPLTTKQPRPMNGIVTAIMSTHPDMMTMFYADFNGHG